MNTLQIKAFFLLLISSFIGHTQNLLDTSTWTIGSGSVTGFAQSGIAAENYRELGYDHVGNQVTLWTAIPDMLGATSGGFTSEYQTIDHTKSYRLTVWIKKTNSNSGTSYFVTRSNTAGVFELTTLAGTVISSPYFWTGDLPELDKWYLLVGYVHNSGYASGVHQGRMYDGVTGEVVQTLTDFKFTSQAANLFHSSFLYDDTNINDRQYFCKPRLEVIDGSEYSMNKLLSINPDSKLIFAYDNSGNQKQRFYCIDAGCSIPTPPAGKQSNDDMIVARQEKEDDILINEDGILSNENQFSVYPNPTKDAVHIQVSNELRTKINSINIYNVNSVLVQSIVFNQEEKLNFSLQGQPTGVYFVHLHIDGGDSITKKIIKQ